ncbi:clathrin light chain isoform X5 [Anopheles darlingi]|uniref:clathrin light chain isoform X5 n=1 Tax=Anopheles darlingi TaxID=43151 RepID=UPI00210030D9|nr:clathrin light chain isoform X5 [Anopheles darlingi]
MNAFGDNFEQPSAESDPAAEFLAREQNALAGLEDEIPPVAAAATAAVAGTNGSLDGEPVPKAVPKQVTEEPEKIRKWREDQKARLEEKDREEERKKDELREQARKELEDWYKHHDEAISKTKAANRESAKNAEKQFVAETDEIEPGTEWERIAKLCDFNPKTNKSSKDISRMRSIILQLKQNPIQSTKKI